MRADRRGPEVRWCGTCRCFEYFAGAPLGWCRIHGAEHLGPSDRAEAIALNRQYRDMAA